MVVVPMENQIVMLMNEDVSVVKIVGTAWFTETNSVEMEDADKVRWTYKLQQFWLNPVFQDALVIRTAKETKFVMIMEGAEQVRWISFIYFLSAKQTKYTLKLEVCQ